MKPIPRDLIRHLEWHPDKELPKVPPSPQSISGTPVQQQPFSIDDLVKNGKEFYDANLPAAFRKTQEYATHEGVVASMPYHIAGKAVANKRNYLWKNWFTVLTEEDVGIDKKGSFVEKGKHAVIVFHGGGILTPDRIQQAYDEGLTPQHAAKLEQEDEIDKLLDGTLRGESIKLYTVDDVKNAKVSNPFSRYGIVLDFETAKAIESGYHDKKAFMNNPLVLARAGTLEYLESYFDKAKSSDTVGNWHPFNNRDPSQAQGRLLFLDNSYDGLVGNYLGGDGRFVGVAPEAQRAKK